MLFKLEWFNLQLWIHVHFCTSIFPIGYCITNALSYWWKHFIHYRTEKYSGTIYIYIYLNLYPVTRLNNIRLGYRGSNPAWFLISTAFCFSSYLVAVYYDLQYSSLLPKMAREALLNFSPTNFQCWKNCWSESSKQLNKFNLIDVWWKHKTAKKFWFEVIVTCFYTVFLLGPVQVS